MKKNKLILIVLTALIFLTGCATTPAAAPTATYSIYSVDDTNLQARYDAAVKDGEVPEPEEISKNLTAITEYNKNLIWNDGKVLVVTWTSYNGYKDFVGKEYAMNGYEAWVTAAPELQNFMKNAHALNDKELTLRLEQLLGLPPGNGSKWFVEFWVSPEDLIRPAYDPEIIDTTTGLTFQEKKGSIKIKDNSTVIIKPVVFLQTDEEYKKWFESTYNGRYGADVTTKYPWTQLGYTYDWGNKESEIGLSEFVINMDANVTVHSVSSMEEYRK